LIPQSFIQELLSRVDVVEVVDRLVPLKKAGANYAACCPFHAEKSPSFTVSPTKQFYHCFGCGAHGSAIGFLMEYSGLSYPEAIRELAGQIGLNVPEDESATRTATPDTSSLSETMARAAKFYREQLKSSARAVDYLKRRGLTGEIAAQFGLGYAPDAWQSLEAVFADYGARELLEVGLVIENDQGRRYDRFRDRIMFPIQDQRGNVIGFGGRVIDQGEPKYLNSPETPLFEKGRELYGLTQARAAIRDVDSVIVVEGYMDVVALAQHGVPNAVATLGTATTGTHVQKLLRQAGRVIFCFDGDNAGRKAAWRALEASLEQLADDKTVCFLFLPSEHDPDSFIRERGRDAFNAEAARAVPLAGFLMRELLGRHDMASAEGRAGLLHDAKPLIGRVQAPLLRLAMVKELAAASGFSQPEVESSLGLKPSVPPWSRNPRAATRAAPKHAPSLSRTLLKLIVHQPELAARLPFELIPQDRIETPLLGAIADAVSVGDIGRGSPAMLLEHFRQTSHASLLGDIAHELVDDPFEESAIEPLFCDLLDGLREQARGGEFRKLQEKLAGGRLDPHELARYRELLTQKQKLGSGQSGPQEDRIAGFSDSSAT
jgi:DNA primase